MKFALSKVHISGRLVPSKIISLNVKQKGKRYLLCILQLKQDLLYFSGVQEIQTIDTFHGQGAVEWEVQLVNDTLHLKTIILMKWILSCSDDCKHSSFFNVSQKKRKLKMELLYLPLSYFGIGT